METNESRQTSSGSPPEPVPQLPSDAAKNGEVPTTQPQDDNVVVVIKGIPLELPRTLEAAFQRAIASSKRPLPEEMSIGQAADFLDVSREYIIKRIKRGELPCRLLGKRRRIPTPALLEQREQRNQQAIKAAKEITRISQELGLYQSDTPRTQEQ